MAELPRYTMARIKWGSLTLYSTLEQWLKDAVASGVRSLISFANGIRQDFTAVYNALSLIWSNELIAYCTSSTP